MNFTFLVCYFMIEFFQFLPPQYYQAFFITLIILLCLVQYFRYSTSSNCNLLLKKHSFAGPMILMAFLTLFVGLRPATYAFGDTGAYAWSYYNTLATSVVLPEWKSEWFFGFITSFCASSHWSVNIYLFVIAAFFFFFHYLACLKLLPENPWFAFLFVLSSYCLWGYATNGLRAGMASSMLAFAIVIIATRKSIISFIPAILLCVFAFGTHRSMVLPILALFAATFVIKKPKYAIFIWGVSLVVYFVFGNNLINIVQNSSFDERAMTYGKAVVTEGQFSRTGFRWDFVLYSLPPIVLTWYIVETRKIQDKTFNILATTYILANAAWVSINEIKFSNRFAYLSWFLYAYVIAYAVIRIPLWKDQDRRASLFLMGVSLFTFFMFLIGK